MDAGITTDVDRLIFALRAAPGKMHSIRELAAITGMAEKAVRKWVQALETEGKVTVRYSITDELVAWIAANTHETTGMYAQNNEASSEETYVREAKDEKIQTGAPTVDVPPMIIPETAGISDAKPAGDAAKRRRQYQRLLAEKKMLLEQLILLETSRDMENAKKNARMPQKAQEIPQDDEILRIVEGVREKVDMQEGVPNWVLLKGQEDAQLETANADAQEIADAPHDEKESAPTVEMGDANEIAPQDAPQLDTAPVETAQAEVEDMREEGDAAAGGGYHPYGEEPKAPAFPLVSAKGMPPVQNGDYGIENKSDAELGEGAVESMESALAQFRKAIEMQKQEHGETLAKEAPELPVEVKEMEDAAEGEMPEAAPLDEVGDYDGGNEPESEPQVSEADRQMHDADSGDEGDVGGMPIKIVPSAAPSALATAEIGAAAQATSAREEEKASFIPKIPSAMRIGKDAKLDEFSGRLAAHMARIHAKAAEIGKIKAEKKRLLHEVYAPLAAKSQDELEAITDRILDYENRLLALRGHVAGLPGQVADVSERHEKMAELSRQMQRLYDETEAMSEESLRGLLEARDNASVKADDVRTMQFEQEGILSSLKGELSRVNALQAEAEGRLHEANEALSRQAEGVRKAESELERAAGVRAQIEGELEQINSEMRRQKTIMSDLDTHLERMDSVAKWVDDNRRDYRKKMNALAEYVKSGENEYASIRESVEANFVSKYLRELRAVSESYEFELSQAKEAEVQYDRDIAKAKSELERMIEEAKKIAQMQEMQLDDAEYAPAQGGEERMLAGIGANISKRQTLRRHIRDAIEGKVRRRIAKKGASRKLVAKGRKK